MGDKNVTFFNIFKDAVKNTHNYRRLRENYFKLTSRRYRKDRVGTDRPLSRSFLHAQDVSMRQGNGDYSTTTVVPDSAVPSNPTAMKSFTEKAEPGGAAPEGTLQVKVAKAPLIPWLATAKVTVPEA